MAFENWRPIIPADPGMALHENGGEPAGIALVSSSSVGAINRGRVLQALYDNGPTSRVDLARMANVNRTTITGIVQPMIEQGLLIEGDARKPTAQGGKPARPLYFNPKAPMLGAVLLLPGSIQTCLVTLTGGTFAHRDATFDPNGGVEDFLSALSGTLRETIAQADQPPFGIGIAAGGMIDSDAGVIVAVNLAPVLSGLPLVAALREEFSPRIVIDHHPRALLVGDRWFGQGRRLQNFASIYTGEVLGGAFYLGGKVYRGLAGSGGELGHTVVQLDGLRCNCGKRGCWETIGTLTWLRAQAAESGLDDPAAINSARLSGLAAEGNAAAMDLLQLYARNIAIGIANLQQTLSLNTYILHGDAATGGKAMADLVRRHVETLVMMRPNQEIAVVANGGGEDHTALRGAAGLVVSDLLDLEI
jgi:predicted NBD/HSP70 family sugar kinase